MRISGNRMAPICLAMKIVVLFSQKRLLRLKKNEKKIEFTSENTLQIVSDRLAAQSKN